MRLGLGEFEESDDYSREFTRIRFLVVAEKIEQKILSEASREPFTLFQEFVNRVPDGERDALWNGLNDSWRSIENSTRATEFLDSLWRWARRWNLEADWCIDRTILALRRYLDGKWRGLRGDLSWFYPLYTIEPEEDGTKRYLDKIDAVFEYPLTEDIPVYYSGPLSLPSPPGGLPDWDPKLDPLREGYLARVERRARQRLGADPYLSVVPSSHRLAYAALVRSVAADYAARVEAQVGSGLKKVSTKPKLRTHLDWTVRVWVLGTNYSQVARTTERKSGGDLRTNKTVAKAVKQILELIEPAWAARLEKRFRPGRPPEP